MNDMQSIFLAQPRHYYTILQDTSDEKIHTHSFWELVCQVKGTSYNTVNNYNYTLHTGDVLLLKPGDVHQIIYGEKALVRDIYIQPPLFKKITTGFNYDFVAKMSDQRPLEFSLNPSILSTLENEYIIFDLYPEHTTSMDDIHSCFIHMILGQYLCHAVDSHPAPPLWMRELMQTLSTYTTYNEPIDVIIKKLANYSYGHVAREFKKHLSITLDEYVTQIKMRRAARLLVDSTESIETISSKIGYKSSTGFIKAFAKYYNTTPHQYRKSHKQEYNR